MARSKPEPARLDPLKYDTSIVISDKHARIIRALQDEVRYWRIEQTLRVTTAYHLVISPTGERNWLQFNPPKRQLESAIQTLADALSGDLFDECEACKGDIRAGDPVISYTDLGEVHARCAGAKPGHIAAGRMPIEADAFDYSEMDPEAAAALRADPHVSIHLRSELFSSAQILEWIDKGKSALAAAVEMGEADRSAAIAAHFAASQGDVGGRYGLTPSAERSSIPHCRVWYSDKAEAFDYAAREGLTVWDLVEGIVATQEPA